MRNTLFTVAVFTIVLAAADANAVGWLSRYWDGCKPSCSWAGNAGGNPCKECDKQNNKLNTSDANRNACEGGGTSYTCWDMIPFQVDANTAYGFVATHPPNRCATCYEITFNGSGQHGNTSRHTAIRGKKMIVMASNIGGDVQGEQLDLLVPGGGVGAFDAFSNQIGKQKSELGAQYGGLLSDCESQGDVAGCLRTKCASVFSGQALLKQGCEFYADWLMAAGNPQFDSKSVSCPDVLVNIYKGTATGPGGGPIITPTTYTLQVARNPTAGGNVAVTAGGNTQNNPSGQLTQNANTSIAIAATPATGYSFENWTAVSGSLPSGITATNASITFSITGNVNIRANFKQTTTPPTTYTLQVSRNPTAGGNVAVTVGTGSPQTNPQNSQTVNANTSVTVSATAASGYTFENWTAVSGSLPTGFSATSESATFSIGANVNIRANFKTVTTNPDTKYTLTVTRNPIAGGTTTPASSQSDIAAGTPVSISATVSSGYTFTEWTLVSGTATFANAKSASTTVTLSSNATIRANFQSGSIGGGSKDTITVEAEDATVAIAACPASPPGDQGMCVGTNTSTGVTNIGYIGNGNSATYEVDVARGGTHTMVFRIASNWDQGQSSFKVTVNNTEVGTISGNTNDWDGYTYVTLASDVQFSAGTNSIRLDFLSPINVDHFLIIGEAQVSVRYLNTASRAVKRANIALTASPRGFTATLPTNHGYTTYRLIDLQGREVRSGKVGDGISTLKFNNLKNSVLLLRLEGKNTSTVVKAVTY